MEQQEIAQIMQASATEAKAIMAKEFGIELDDSPASLAEVDKALAVFAAQHLQKALSDEHIFTLCNLFGAYAGEVFKKQIGGEWIFDDSTPEEPFIALRYNGISFPFPGICYQKLVNEPAVSIRRYYELAQEKVTQ